MPVAATGHGPGPGPSGTGPPGRRSDAGTVRFTARDIAGLMLTGDMYGAPYGLYRPYLTRERAARLRHGRPGVLAARLAGAGILAEITLHSGAGPAPAAGTLTGIVTWLVLTARGDFAPPSGR